MGKGKWGGGKGGYMESSVIINEWGSFEEFLGEGKSSAGKVPPTPPSVPVAIAVPVQPPLPLPIELKAAKEAHRDHEAYQREIEDNRDEIRNMYNYQRISPAKASKEQLATLRKMLKDRFLFKEDFTDPHKFHKKKKLLIAEADTLIKLGIQRQKEDKSRGESEIGLRWKIY